MSCTFALVPGSALTISLHISVESCFFVSSLEILPVDLKILPFLNSEVLLRYVLREETGHILLCCRLEGIVV